MAQPPDFTGRFNTQLSPAEEQAFQAWLAKSGKEGDLRDYDLRGAWKADAKAAANGHLPDTWKKPNHPTFSTESVYNGVDGKVGGEWIEEGKDKWRFVASRTNVANMGRDGLNEYFRRTEPDAKLEIPPPGDLLYGKPKPRDVPTPTPAAPSAGGIPMESPQ
jgi:hypothetical protein